MEFPSVFGVIYYTVRGIDRIQMRARIDKDFQWGRAKIESFGIALLYISVKKKIGYENSCFIEIMYRYREYKNFAIKKKMCFLFF